MKTLFLFITFFSPMIKVFGQINGIYIEDYKIYDWASEYKLIGEYKNGQREGQWKRIDIKEGRVFELINFNDGKINGEKKTFYKNGIIGSVENFKNDKREGEARYFYENGKRRCFKNYKSDLLEGQYIEYFENGNIYIKGNYSNGKKNGEWLYFEGELKFEFEKDWGGNKIVTIDKSLEYYEMGKRVGEWRTYFKNGKLKIIKNYKNDKLDGEQKYFFENGNIKSIEIYHNDIIEGRSIYYSNGKLKEVVKYRNKNIIFFKTY